MNSSAGGSRFGTSLAGLFVLPEVPDVSTSSDVKQSSGLDLSGIEATI